MVVLRCNVQILAIKFPKGNTLVVAHVLIGSGTTHNINSKQNLIPKLGCVLVKYVPAHHHHQSLKMSDPKLHIMENNKEMGNFLFQDPPSPPSKLQISNYLVVAGVFQSFKIVKFSYDIPLPLLRSLDQKPSCLWGWSALDIILM